jgi:energy-converting hydrogenase Eha subunit C
MGLTAAQGYADCMARALPEPVCTWAYYLAQVAAMRDRLWECKRKIEEMKS